MAAVQLRDATREIARRDRVLAKAIARLGPTNKLASLRDLAAKVSDGTVAPTRSSVRADEDLIEQLTAVRGIGPWTAQMYLLFQLRRLDVWPVSDLGVRQGYALIWAYRTVVARYCWAALAEQRTQRLPTAL